MVADGQPLPEAGQGKVLLEGAEGMPSLSMQALHQACIIAAPKQDSCEVISQPAAGDPLVLEDGGVKTLEDEAKDAEDDANATQAATQDQALTTAQVIIVPQMLIDIHLPDIVRPANVGPSFAIDAEVMYKTILVVLHC